MIAAPKAVFFKPGSEGWDEAWNGLAKAMSALIGNNQGRRAAYQALKNHCRLDNQAIPSDSAKRLMEIVLNGLPGDVDRCVMESKVFDGETWQYMGTFYEDNVGGNRHWRHQFRHRHLDLQGGRRTVNIACTVQE